MGIFIDLVNDLDSDSKSEFEKKLDNIIKKFNLANKEEFTYFLKKLNFLYNKNNQLYSYIYDENIFHIINSHAIIILENPLQEYLDAFHSKTFLDFHQHGHTDNNSNNT